MTPSEDPLADLPWPKPHEPRAAVSAEIRKRCTHNLCEKRGLTALRRWMLSLVLAAGVFGLLFALSLGRERPEGGLRAALFGAAGWAMVLSIVLFVGLARPPGRRISRLGRLLIAIVLPIAFLAYLGLEGHAVPFATFAHTAAAGRALGCGLHALLFGALASGGILLIWRRTDPLTPGLSGALAGLVGGVTGALAIGMVCPSTEIWHLWVGHGLTVVVLGVLGWVAGRRWLTP